MLKTMYHFSICRKTGLAANMVLFLGTMVEIGNLSKYRFWMILITFVTLKLILSSSFVTN